jgi:hypothetical protein
MKARPDRHDGDQPHPLRRKLLHAFLQHFRWHSFLFLPFGNEIGKLWITAKMFLDKFAFGDNLQSASSGYVENRPNERSANTATSEIVSHEGVYQFKSAIGDCVVHESRFAVDDRLEALAAFVIGDFQHEDPLFPAYAQRT